MCQHFERQILAGLKVPLWNEILGKKMVSQSTCHCPLWPQGFRYTIHMIHIYIYLYIYTHICISFNARPFVSGPRVCTWDTTSGQRSWRTNSERWPQDTDETERTPAWHFIADLPTDASDGEESSKISASKDLQKEGGKRLRM